MSGDVAGWGEAGKFDPPEPTAATIEHVLSLESPLKEAGSSCL